MTGDVTAIEAVEVPLDPLSSLSVFPDNVSLVDNNC
jgi:hypothetical protein